jgi:small-conductance mechanosensitive channel
VISKAMDTLWSVSMKPYKCRDFQSRVCRFLLIVLTVSVLLGGTAAAQMPTTPTTTPEVSQAQVQDLIRLLEDEPARTAFLQRLKALSRLQAETSASELGATKDILSYVSYGIELAIQHTLAASRDIFHWLRQTPQFGRDLWTWVSNPETHRAGMRHLQHLVFSVVPALLVLLVLRRLMRAVTPLTLPTGMWPSVQRLWQALRHVLVRVLPTAGFVIVAIVLLGLLQAAPTLQETVRFLLSVALVYQVLTQCFWVSLAPDEPTARLFALADETASYLWVWARRFLLYGVAYTFLLYSLQWFYPDPSAYQGVRGLLLCVFPALVTILVAQIVRQRAHPSTVEIPEAGERVLHTTQRVLYTLWPFLVVIYAWGLTLSIISHQADRVSYLIWASIKTLLVTLGLLLVLRVFNRLFDVAFRIRDQLRQRYPLLEERANRYLKVLRDVCNGLLVLLAIGMVLEFWGVPTSWFLTSPLGTQLLARVLIIAMAVGVISVAMGVSKAVADILLQTKVDAQGVVHEPSRKRKTLVPLAHAVLKVAMVFVGVLIVLEQLNINTGPILAGVGILGLAVGFGAQSLVKDVINGLFILFEDSISVGDVAILRDTGGLVEKVTLRTVTLRDLAGNVHVIPNSSIDMVTNMTKEYSRYILDVGVAYREDVDEVINILKEIDAEMRADPAYGGDMLEPIDILGLDRFADSAVVIRARLITKPIRQWRVGREFNRRMKKIFDERGIEIPFPHRTLYWGMPKQGAQQPIQVALGEPQSIDHEH